MYIKRLTVVNFKNHSQRDFSFTKKINCFAGSNGAGKTNILDALYYLSFTKSFLNQFDIQSIKNGEEFFSVRGVYQINNIEETFLCTFQKDKNKKSFKRNDKEYDKLSSHIGFIPAVLIYPQDVKLIYDSSAERRKFLDGAVSQYDTAYLSAFQKYNKALLQRNFLLKSFATSGKFDFSSLELYNISLVKYGNMIYKARTEFIKDFIPEFEKYYSLISGGGESVKLCYNSVLNQDDFESILSKNLERDRFLQYTSTGVHKDDLIFEIDSMPIKNAGSQGQQKSFLAALKFALFFFLKNKDRTPILLLDDIFDKLDNMRVKRIADMISGNDFTQVFITHTDSEQIEKIFSDVEIFSL